MKKSYIFKSILLLAISVFGAGLFGEEVYGKRFGEMYLNLGFNFEHGKLGERWHRSKFPIGAGVWDFDARAKEQNFLRIFGRDGSQAYIKLSYGDGSKEALVYSPTGEFAFFIPSANEISGDERGEFKSGKNFIRVKVPTYKEIFAYKNLALNPYDFQEKRGLGVTFYPHTTASSECRDELQFAARNAIDGFADNTKHGGWKYRSWGPEQEKRSEIKIDFNREVEVDKINVFLRADFSHDDIWQSGSVEFSDGKKIPLKFVKQAEMQTFEFKKTKTTFVKITDLNAPTNAWRAMTEIEVWGRDVPPFKAFNAQGKKLEFSQVLSELKIPANPVLNRWTWRMLDEVYPIESDWLLQDAGFDLTKFPANQDARAKFFLELVSKTCEKILDKASADKIRREINNAKNCKDAAELYLNARNIVRLEFLAKLEGNANKFIYVERYPIAPSFYGYTEGLSDARDEVIYAPDSALCLLTILPDGKISREVLLEDKNGVIRDPDVSYDGKKVLFSWKKHPYNDDYNIYELNLKTRKIRQITNGKSADIEAKYLPTGEIVFNSTRCEQTTDCATTEVSNLYMMKPDGSFMRRVGFDQVCTTCPSVTEQGDVVYTRWDYNDRGQVFTQALFLMKPDGSFQTELYGNKSWYPTAMGHARQIPNTNKFLATLHGHHTAQRGKLAEIDPSKGRQEDAGVELLAPRRKEKAVRTDGYGQRGEQFQYPFPLSEDLFVVTYEPTDARNRSYPSPYGLYLMNPDGRREILVSHPYLDCKQAVAVAPRKIPELEKSRVDYSKDKGYLFIRNIYYGDGVKGIKKGTIKKVRVVKLDYRRAPVGSLNGRNKEGGVEVSNMVCTPVALGQATWDVKEILGEVDVAPDGSVYFEIPARTPVYFQPIDENGCAVTTMRSWTTMQPNEFYSCLGCHGDRDVPNPIPLKIAKNRKPQKLKPFYDVTGGFSFTKQIQPILDKHCITCHNDRSVPRIVTADGKSKLSVSDIEPTSGKEWLDLEKENSQKKVRAFSLLNYPIKNKHAKRIFNDAYYNLLQPQMHTNGAVNYADFTNPLINWAGMQSVPTLLPPYYRGAAKSGIIPMLKNGHGKVKLSREEFDKICAWIDLYVPFCGDYYEGNIWSERDMKFYKYYEEKGKANEEAERKAIEDYLRQKSNKKSK